MWLWVWVALACGGDVLQDGPWRISGRDGGFCAMGLEPALTGDLVIDGELVALNRNGVLFLSDAGEWSFCRFSDRQTTALKAPGQPYLQSRLENVDGPAFVNQTQLIIWHADQWQVMDLDVFVEYQGLGSVPGSQHGLNLIFPQIFQAPDGTLVTYQPKTGTMTHWNTPGGPANTQSFERGRRAIFLGQTLVWLGAPKEEKAALAKPGSLVDLGDNTYLDNLNKHSLAIPRQAGCWVLTFPSGFRDGLKSWDSGKLPLEAFYLRVDGDRKLHKLSHELPKLPLTFDLTTSASGSPRLDVQPQFKVVAIYQTEWIAVLSGKMLHTLSPAHGVKSHVLAGDAESFSSLVRKGADLAGMNANGKWETLVEGLF